MAISSASLDALKLAGGWLVAGAVVVGGLFYQDDIRTALGLRITADDIASVATAASARIEQPAEQQRSDRAVEIRAGSNGHFETTAYINGRAVQVMIDTGATTVAMPFEDAEAAGIFVRDSDFNQRVQTANGTARVASVMLSTVQIDDIILRNVRGAVVERGKLQTTLLGMSFLGRLSKTETSKGILLLHE